MATKPPDDHLGKAIKLIVVIKPLPPLAKGLIRGVTVELETEGPTVTNAEFETAKTYQQLASVLEDMLGKLLEGVHSDYQQYVKETTEKN